ncbi:AraC family transcriptional regulator [Phyllobacterium sp. YR531]|uniref:helix-turn-helix transcriptional regulator n=1 Tax=Phyllobacterium sp. YR531 TaxID=1144343 RepID=UPI0012F697E9|nr:AraC family transcriptional regulator [Phyllobacterium sp. YR531]
MTNASLYEMTKMIRAELNRTTFSCRDIAAILRLGRLPAETDAHDVRAVNHSPIKGEFTVQSVVSGIHTVVSDIRCNDDFSLVNPMRSSLMCLVLLGGSPITVHSSGRPAITLDHQRPIILNFSHNELLELRQKAGSRSAVGGIVICPEKIQSPPWSSYISDFSPLLDFYARPNNYLKLLPSQRCVRLVSEILSHNYNGKLRKLYLESVVLAFIVEIIRLMQVRDSHSEGLNLKHFGKVLAAREIIDSDIVNPPTAHELSQQVGVNITTLRINFRIAFNNSIGGYIHDRRLDKARALLRTQAPLIADVSRLVGYTNATAFATAYRKHFGYPPSQEVKTESEMDRRSAV